ncbi:alpha/beta hydrolase [Nocardia vaccinii]|uniref:alpha/beta hydrolase n=1 Tax=Nocardia vaccinii TaxID=1822 RepID=UPI0014714F54|nr:alpha/beta hydrolase [Nocardia vaccinii]
MSEFDPAAIDSALELYPGIRRANMIARRLESMIREAGEGIAENLYRKTRDAVVRGDGDLLADDEHFARIIGEAARSERLPEVARPRVPDIGIPEDPRVLHEFWPSLTESDKRELLRADPLLGNRDGIPRAERYEFNKLTVDTLQEQARRSGDHMRADTYNDLQSMIYRTRRGEPEFNIAYVDDRGRFAIDLDNPDFADNTVIVLNPAGAADAPTAYADETMSQMRQIATTIEPAKNTSITLWGAYDNPHSMTESMFPQFAEDGAAMAREYHEGLRITHVGDPSHNTTIGHSYGSVLAGHAAGHGAVLNTDDLVLIGSWGMGVRSVGELRLAGVEAEDIGNHVFATMARRDFVQLMPKTHGPAPTSPGFGARVFASSSNPGEPRWISDEHFASHYLDSRNPAAGKLGLIMTGLGHMVR